MNANSQRCSRPMIVTFAVVLLLLAVTIRFVAAFVDVFSDAHFTRLSPYVVLAVFVSIPYVIIWFIFLGKNWARWLFLVVFGLSLCSLLVNFQHFPSQPAQEVAVYIVQMLLGLTAAAALVSSTSAGWFRSGKNGT